MTALLKTTTWEKLEAALGLSLKLPRTSPHTRTTANVPATLTQLMQTVCVDGERTHHLTRLAGALISSGLGDDDCLARCEQWNAANTPPLSTGKVIATLASIRAADRRNNPARYPAPISHVPLFPLSEGRIGRFVSSAPPPRRWLVHELVVLGKVGAVVAPGGSGKSQWLLQLAATVATGLDFAGHWKAGEVGGVLMFCAEDDTDELHRRVYRIVTRMTQDGHAGKLTDLVNNLHVFSTVGVETLLTKRKSQRDVESTIVVDRIVASAAEIPDLKLIVIDPVSRFRGGEENSNEDATRFVEALEAIAQRTGASVMVAHHASKFSQNNQDVGQSASRGASALTDGLRWQMNLSPPTDKQASECGVQREHIKRYVNAAVTKTNYSAIPEAVLLERGDDGYLTAVSAAALKGDADLKSIRMVLSIMAKLGTGMTTRALEYHCAGITGPAKMSKHRFREVLKLASARGFVNIAPRKPILFTPQGRELLSGSTAPVAPAAVAPERAAKRRHVKLVEEQ